jgi:hypothetical protein
MTTPPTKPAATIADPAILHHRRPPKGIMIPLRVANTGTPIPTKLLQEEFRLLSSKFDYILLES